MSRVNDNPSPLSYGTYGCGVNLLKEVWSSHRLVFEYEALHADLERHVHRPAGATVRGHPSRASPSVFSKHPVQVFVADHSRDRTLAKVYGSDGNRSPEWVAWLEAVPQASRPKVLIQVWPQWSVFRDPGPTSKGARKPLERLGYSSRYHVMKGTSFGS